jgi:hypothetical protein
MENELKQEQPQEEMVSVSKLDLHNLMERLAKLESGDKRIKVERVNSFTAKVWFADEEKTQPIVGYGKNRTTKRVDGTEFLEVEIFYDEKGKVKNKWIPLVDFRNSDSFLVGKIIETKKTPIPKDYGYTFVKNIDYDNFRTTESDIEVPMRVIEEEVVHTLELQDGRKFEINANALN